MNLRGLIPGIIEVLGVRSMSWQNTIVVARTFAEGKYAYEEENDGRDDAGEFLGDILYHCRGIAGRSVDLPSSLQFARAWRPR